MGFSLLETRSIDDQVADRILELEFKYGLKLPPLYKLFIETFKPGEIKRQSYLKKDRKWKITSYVYEPDKRIDIMGFAPFEKCFEGYHHNEEVVVENKLFAVAAVGSFDGGMFVGLDGDLVDKIVVDTHLSGTKRFMVVAENIFELVRGLQPFVIPLSARAYGVELSTLYKNWGEDFWRVREE